jgi:hypothetical protein
LLETRVEKPHVNVVHRPGIFMNLFDQFILQHVQISVLRTELVRASREPGMQEAKVELNLTPRVIEGEKDSVLPSYQVSANLNCNSASEDKSGPAFKAIVGLEAVYQQISGDPMDVAEFTNQHSVLARQLYPLLQQEMRGLLARMGLSQIQLPFDLAPRLQNIDGSTIEVSGSLH